MYEDMGIVIAWEGARILTHDARGAVRDDNRRCVDDDEHGVFLHLDAS